jgi:hypothetical protein
MTKEQAQHILDSGIPFKGKTITGMPVNIHPKHVKLTLTPSGEIDMQKLIFIETYGCVRGIYMHLTGIRKR